MYKRIQSRRLYQLIDEQIRESIVRGELKPGDQLPTERELAERFGVSRVAVREAIKVLLQNGLVDVQGGRGTFVVDGAARAVSNSLALLVRMQQGEHVLSDLIQCREILEPEIAALAAGSVTEEALADMVKAIETMDEALDKPEVYIKADGAFHAAVAAASQNKLLPMLLYPVVDLLAHQRMSMFRVAGAPARGQEHHKRILSAIVRHDPEAARSAMRAHLAQVRADTATAVALGKPVPV